MEGLSIVIFIIIGIISSVMKQQNQGKGQGGAKRQQGQYRQKPGKYQMNIPEKPKRAVMDMESSYMPSPVAFEESEGIEVEDRRRAGSLDYVEQNQSLEGVCNEHPEHEQKEKKKAAPKAEAKVIGESPAFEITEDNLIKSIVMAEILGPPRAMKRNIR